MDKEKAAGAILRTREAYKNYTIKTAADIKYVDTSYGPVRVLEYGFDTDEIRPLYVSVHGGGYCVGSPEMDEQICLRIMKEAGVKIISIDYPKAPENPYPIGLEASYEVVRHYYNNSDVHRIDKENIGIGGYSSGGNFATVIPIKAKERKDLKIRYQMLCYPGTNISIDPYSKKGSDKILSKEFLEVIHVCYISRHEHAYEPYASPQLAPKEMLAGLPPALLILGDIDPLYEEGIGYGNNLKAAGVDVETHVFKDADHGFASYKETDDKKRAEDLIVDFIERHSR